MSEHIAFLESLIMSTTLVDKKYRDGVPECVSLIDILDQSADDAKHDAEKAKKRKSSKKMKPRKNGLYPQEELLIRRWWSGHDDEVESGAPGTSREDTTKDRIAQLRIRETQLQMIIILEVLALQPLASVSEDTNGSLPTAQPASIGGGGKQKMAKSKTPEHLSTLIDVHIDRLCIWQSIALEAVKAPSDSVPSQSERPGNSSTSAIHADNILRDFCVEVILPL
jgi:DNA replication regulator SLD3